MKKLFPHRIDNSIRKELVKCQMAAHYRYELGLQSVEDSRVDLIAGKAFAKGIEVTRKLFFGQGKPADKAIEAGIDALRTAYGDFPCPPTSNKTVNGMVAALLYYFEKYPLMSEKLVPYRFPNGELALEMYFELPLEIEHPDDGQRLFFCGNFDAIVEDLEDPDRGLWVNDEKTTSQMGPKWANQWPLDSQMTGYVWGAQATLDRLGVKRVVQGAIINGVAIRKYDFEATRLKTYRPPWMIQRWHDQLHSDIEDWIFAYKNGHHRMALDHACAFYNNPCQFAPLCVSKNPERIMEGGQYVVKFWDPSNRD